MPCSSRYPVLCSEAASWRPPDQKHLPGHDDIRARHTPPPRAVAAGGTTYVCLQSSSHLRMSTPHSMSLPRWSAQCLAQALALGRHSGSRLRFLQENKLRMAGVCLEYDFNSSLGRLRLLLLLYVICCYMVLGIKLGVSYLLGKYPTTK